MRPDDADIRLQLELYADGELDAADRAMVEQLLDVDPAAKEYLLALEEMRSLVAAPIADAAEQVDFGGLFDRVNAQIDLAAASPAQAAARSAELDALVVAYADGQITDAAERRKVEAYIDSNADVRDGFEALEEMRELVRAPIEYAAEQVDFNALALRIDAAIDREIEVAEQTRRAVEKASRPGAWARFVEWIGGRAVVASALTAAAVVMIMLPFTGGDSVDPVEIHNHYYENAAEAVGQEWGAIEKGYDAQFQPGDKVQDMAPVVWIAPEGSGGLSDWEKDPENDPDAGMGAETSL